MRLVMFAAFVVGVVAGAQIGCVVHGGSDDAQPRDTGWVYVCGDGAETRELCWPYGPLALGESLGPQWRCTETRRHVGSCLYRCPGGVGCNALHSCHCPSEAP